MADDFNFMPPGADPALERAYTVAAYADEMPPHGPLIEDAAHFLLHGFDSQADDLPKPPLAKDGDLIVINVLELFADRTAIKQGDGSWRLEPPPPASAHFFAVRHGRGEGWFAESIFSAPENFAAENADELEDETEIKHIAVGRTRDEVWRFRVEDGAPRLEALSTAETIAALWQLLAEAETQSNDAHTRLKALKRKIGKALADDAKQDDAQQDDEA